jgi:hypothetical protein
VYKCVEVLDGANSNSILQKYLWNGEELLSVYDTAATATYYYFSDANKNIGQLMDSSGNTVAKYEYSPFGVQTLASGTYASIRLDLVLNIMTLKLDLYITITDTIVLL